MKDEKKVSTEGAQPNDAKTVTFVNTDRGQADIKTEGGLKSEPTSKLSSAASKDLHKNRTPAEMKRDLIAGINGMHETYVDEAHQAEKARGRAAQKLQVSETDDYQGSRVAPARKDEILPEHPSVAKAQAGEKSESTIRAEKAAEKLAKAAPAPAQDLPSQEELAGVPAGFDKLGLVK